MPSIAPADDTRREARLVQRLADMRRSCTIAADVVDKPTDEMVGIFAAYAAGTITGDEALVALQLLHIDLCRAVQRQADAAYRAGTVAA